MQFVSSKTTHILKLQAHIHTFHLKLYPPIQRFARLPNDEPHDGSRRAHPTIPISRTVPTPHVACPCRPDELPPLHRRIHREHTHEDAGRCEVVKPRWRKRRRSEVWRRGRGKMRFRRQPYCGGRGRVVGNRAVTSPRQWFLVGVQDVHHQKGTENTKCGKA